MEQDVSKADVGAGRENRLGGAASAYLRSARHQPVDWHAWGEEAFALARRQDKPILLDIGAVWCHWCHVMDRESYEHPEIAALINQLFVAVKVDRDERPDVDSRYQAAVASISGQSGWPLTAFLTPEGKPFFGSNYFPPEDRYGRPGFASVLRRMAEAYRTRRAEVEESADSVMQAIESNETFAGRGDRLGGSLGAALGDASGRALLDRIIEGMLEQFDPRYGGFGSQPKFPHPAALDLLIDAGTRPGPLAQRSREVAAFTLGKMAAGGIHDQLAGGFHRYSVDERWIVPHFEKMAYDNSELLRAYTHAFQSFVDPRFARVAASTLRWMDEWLSDRELGGFYASQDADDSLEDDGDYFTWNRAEAEDALSPEEFEVAAAHFNLRVVGDMHHNPAKNVLHVGAEVPALAARLHRSEDEVSALLREGRRKLYAARLRRKTPFVDRTIYTGWNGLCVSAYLAAGRALALPEAVAFALKSLDRVLAAVWSREAGLARVVAYEKSKGTAKLIPAVLEDYTFLANAALDAWEASGELRYFHAAEELAKALLDGFYDRESEGFFDTGQIATGQIAAEPGAGAQTPLGALSARRKPLQDAPTPAGNPVAATLLLRLHALTGDELYRRRAMETLELFSGIVEHLGLYAASYGLALRRVLTPPVQVCVIGSDALAEELAGTALARFSVNKSVVRLRPDQMGNLPPALAQTLPYLPGLGQGSVAVVCQGNACLPLVSDPRRLLEMLTVER